MSGWCLRPEFNAFNAEKRFNVETITADEVAVVYRRADSARLEEAASMFGIRNNMQIQNIRWVRRWFHPKGQRARRIISMRSED